MSMTRKHRPSKSARQSNRQLPPAADQASDTKGIAEEASSNDGASNQLWKQVWKAKQGQIAVVGIALTILLLVFLFQDWIVRYEKWYDRFRLVFLTFTLFYIGWYAQAQLSVVNTLTLILRHPDLNSVGTSS